MHQMAQVLAEAMRMMRMLMIDGTIVHIGVEITVCIRVDYCVHKQLEIRLFLNRS